MSAAKSYRRADSNNNNNKEQQDQSPPVTGYADASEVKRREQMISSGSSSSSEHPQELAADTAASNSLSTVLSELKYPATRKDVLDYLYLRRERIPDVDTILKVVQLLPIDKQYRNASEIGAELGNINEEYNRSRGRGRMV